VWRRFQLRLPLPAPTGKELTEYFARFLTSLNPRTNMSAAAIAKRLGNISYAEAEEFTLDVRRRDVMTMKEHPLKRTIEEQLKLWEKRVQPTRNSEAKQVSDGC